MFAEFSSLLATPIKKLWIVIFVWICSYKMTDYKALYEAKNLEYEELLEQYGELEEQTNLIINDLEEEIKEAKRKN